MEHLLTAISSWIEGVIRTGGYPGIIFLMALESACVPLPSEVIMPFAGALTLATVASLDGTTALNINLVALSGTIGCVLGSLLAYYAGMYGGREFIYRYGKYLLLRRKDIDRTEQWFNDKGIITVFVGRLLPVVRTFISLPAGIARMDIRKFVLLSFLGSLPWCYALAWIGVLVRGNIGKIKGVFHGADALVVAVFLVLMVLFVKSHLKSESIESESEI